MKVTRELDRGEPAMKIAKVETRQCDAGWRNYHFVKVTTESGIVGWSEFDEGFGSPGVGQVVESMEIGQSRFRDHGLIHVVCWRPLVMLN